MPTKYLRSGRPGLRGCGVVADVEARQPRDPADEKEETDEGPGVEQVLVQLRIHGIGQKMESPDERQQAGRHAEGDGVGQRIQLLAEVAAGVGHARDAAVERVEGNGENDGDGRPVQVRVRVAGVGEGRHGLGDGKEAGGDVAHGKQRGQQEHAAAQLRPRPGP